MATDALVAALVDAARELGRCTAGQEATRVDFAELRDFVNEQLAVNYRDLADRIGKLEEARAQRRGRWQVWAAIGGAVTGATGIAALFLHGPVK